jgi:hypothetical protein
MTSWLTTAGVDEHTTMTILIASGEACSNAIERTDHGTTVRLTKRLNTHGR